MAGFRKAIFVIKKENEDDFRALIDEKAGKYIDVAYAYQELTDLPQGYNRTGKLYDEVPAFL